MEISLCRVLWFNARGGGARKMAYLRNECMWIFRNSCECSQVCSGIVEPIGTKLKGVIECLLMQEIRKIVRTQPPFSSYVESSR